MTFDSLWPATIARADGSPAKLAGLDETRPRDVRVLFDHGSDLVWCDC